MTTVELAAGSDDVAVPFAVGAAPRLTLVRGGKVVVEASGADRIEAAPRYNDFYCSTGEAVARTRLK